MKLIHISIVCFMLTACQTTGSFDSVGGVGKGDVNVFEIPPEMSRIVLPDGYVADRVTVTVDGGIVDELVYSGALVVRYKTAPDGFMTPTLKPEFIRTIDKAIEGFNSVYLVPATPIRMPNIGFGNYTVTEDSTELCFFSITSSGPSEVIKGKKHYTRELIITICLPWAKSETRPNFVANSLSLLGHLNIRDIPPTTTLTAY